jgi:hypothetical protein
MMTVIRGVLLVRPREVLAQPRLHTSEELRHEDTSPFGDSVNQSLQF